MHRVYISKSNDPAFNLAFEEYLVKTSSDRDSILYLWQNENTIVIGRNQNPWKECEWKKLKQDGGRMVRRPSGGGAVYHDLGNLNFTFISGNSDDKVQENVKIVIDALQNLGIAAHFSGKNDILVDEYKISGNAYFIEGEILCHHGTLLVDVDITKLSNYLKISELKLKSKGIDSVRSRVKNLIQINNNLKVDTLRDSLIDTFLSNINDKETYYIDENSEIPFKELIKKYNSWEWNFGSSPQFDIQLRNRFIWGEIDLNLFVEDGIVEDVKVYSDSMDPNFSQNLEAVIKGIKFEKSDFIMAVEKMQNERKSDVIDWLKNIDF